MSPFIRFELAVYLPADQLHASERPMLAVKESLQSHPNLQLVNELPEAPQTMMVRAHLNEKVKDSYAPPSARMLQRSGHGLTAKQSEWLQRSTRAIILQFAHPRKDVWTAVRTAAGLVSEIAEKTGGLVWDEGTREVFTPEAWGQRRMTNWTEPPRISSQTTIHVYNNGQSVRAITLGMAKMGLPDLIIENKGWSSINQTGNLINLVSQALAEGQPLTKSGEFKLVLEEIRNADLRNEIMKSLKPNATRIGCLVMVPGRWEEGDPHNSLVQLSFGKYPGNDSNTMQESMAASFFGWEDHVTYMNHHNEELQAASALARKHLPELKKSFLAGFQPGEFVELKAPFKTQSGGTEWMWVEVTAWKGSRISGVLDNEPENIPNLHSGQHVDILEEEVFDYLLTFADKRTEGNTTSAIIKRMETTAGSPKPVILQPVIPACNGS